MIPFAPVNAPWSLASLAWRERDRKNSTTRGICPALSITPLSARGHDSGLGLAFIPGLLGATWSPLA